MKALIYRRFGDPDVLEWVEEWPVPDTRPDHVLVRVVAGGLNPKDVLLRKGKFSRTMARDPLPRVSGIDIAGEVIAIGGEVTDFLVGDAVFGMTNRFSGGVHAEIALLDAGEIAHAPSGISAVTAACVPLAAQTALQALRDMCRVTPGRKVLINGASGGVGHFAVQIAKILGAETHAVCGPRHTDFVASLGADAVYDYTVQPAPLIGATFDCVFDVFGRYSRQDLDGPLGHNGVFVSTVPKAVTLWGELLAWIGIDRRSRLVRVRSRRSDLNLLGEWLASGRLRPHVDKVYPMAEAGEAHRHIETRHTTGKIVLSLAE